MSTIPPPEPKPTDPMRQYLLGDPVEDGDVAEVPGFAAVYRGQGWRYIHRSQIHSMHVGLDQQDRWRVFVGLDLGRLPGEWGVAYLSPAHEAREDAFAQMVAFAKSDPRNQPRVRVAPEAMPPED